MKKVLITILIIVIIIFNTKGDSFTIPKEAIRFRVIANSNSIEDQNIKHLIKTTVEKDLYNLLQESSTIDLARQTLSTSIPKINDTILRTLQQNNINYKHNTNFGSNYFPKKEYKGIIYEEGNYESLVVTLGKGEGDNWWCVLFPPLCLLEAEEKQTDEIEYQFFVKKLIDKYLK